MRCNSIRLCPSKYRDCVFRLNYVVRTPGTPTGQQNDSHLLFFSLLVDLARCGCSMCFRNTHERTEAIIRIRIFAITSILYDFFMIDCGHDDNRAFEVHCTDVNER